MLESKDAGSLQLIYSGDLITSGMRALGNSSASFESRLEDWLSLYGLGLVRTNSGSVLIARTRPASPYIAGRLFDAQGQPVANTALYIAALDRHIVTSESGCFVVRSKAGISRSELSVKGFQPYVISDLSRGWHAIHLRSASSTPAIEDVIVIGSRHSLMHAKTSAQQSLHRDNIERLPHLGDDITRVFRHLPGAASGDISPKVNSRGGAQNETTMVLEGLELHRPWYFKGVDGVVSIVDSNTIKSVDVLAGGFTADYSGNTSAIVNIATLSPKDVGASLGISFLTAYGQAAGEFDKTDGGWLASLRAGYLDLALRLTGDNSDLDPRYYDLFSTVEFSLTDSTDLALHFLSAHDSLHLNDLVRNIKYGQIEDTSSNNNLWLNLRTDYSDNLHGTNTLFVTTASYELNSFYHDPELTWRDLRDYDAWGAKTAWVAKLHEHHLLKWGVEIKNVAADYDYFLSVKVAPYHDNLLYLMRVEREALLQPSGQEQGAYLSYRFRLFDWLTSEVGGRWERQTYLDEDEGTNFGPRINLAYNPTPSTSFMLSWGRFWQAQAIDELFPGDADTVFHPSQEAEHSVLSANHALTESLNFRVDIYEKKYLSLLPRYENLYEDIGRFINEATLDRVRIAPDTALARGVELGVNYDGGNYFSAWANYSFSEVEDYFVGRAAPRLWDQRHAANISLNWDSGTWAFNITGMVRSGWPTTPLYELSSRSSSDVMEFDPERHNTERLDGYSRVDIRLMRKVTFSDGDFLQLYFEIYNLFDTENPCCIDYKDSNSGSGYSGNVSDNWLTRMPSVGVRYRF